MSSCCSDYCAHWGSFFKGMFGTPGSPICPPGGSCGRTMFRYSGDPSAALRIWIAVHFWLVWISWLIWMVFGYLIYSGALISGGIISTGFYETWALYSLFWAALEGRWGGADFPFCATSVWLIIFMIGLVFSMLDPIRYLEGLLLLARIDGTWWIIVLCTVIRIVSLLHLLYFSCRCYSAGGGGHSLGGGGGGRSVTHRGTHGSSGRAHTPVSTYKAKGQPAGHSRVVVTTTTTTTRTIDPQTRSLALRAGSRARTPPRHARP